MAATTPSGVSASVARRAVEWAVELESEDSDAAARHRFQEWLDSDPEHRRAWHHLQEMQTRLRGAAAPVGGEAVRTALLSPRRAARRDLIKSLMVLSMFGGAWSLTEQRAWRDWTADLRTGTGERRTLDLADGTRLILNAGSAVNVNYGQDERRLDLVHGEILVETAPDPRPMKILTARARFRPVGTRFAVRTGERRDRLDVFAGTVEVAPVGGGAVRRVAAGQRTWVSAAEVRAVEALSADSDAWIDGMLVADGMRLVDFLSELGRYRPGYLGCDPAIAGWRVSGTFPLADTGRVLHSLAQTLPVHIHYVTRYWVRISALDEPGAGTPA